MLNDAVGRWLLSSEHLQANSELALSYVDEKGGTRNLVIDRTFIDGESGVRWLIDYKNSQPERGETPAHFFSREESQYSAQLLQYKAAMGKLSAHPITCALYFTALGQLHIVTRISDAPAKA